MKFNPEHLTAHYLETGSLDAKTVKTFQQGILAHFHANPRPMPWRETRDPYHILVSEIMLQPHNRMQHPAPEAVLSSCGTIRTC